MSNRHLTPEAVHNLVRDILLYSGELPEPGYVLRIPTQGVPWRKLMQAANRLVRRLRGTSERRAPYWNIDGDAPDWHTTKFHRYTFNPNSNEFEFFGG